MRFQRILLSLVLPLCFLVLVACGGGISQENYDKIKSGMSTKEVHDILGEPAEKNGAGIGVASGAIHTWKDGEKSIVVTFLNDKVTIAAKKGF